MASIQLITSRRLFSEIVLSRRGGKDQAGMNVGARTLGSDATQAAQNQACGTDEGHATGHPHAYDYTPLQQARGTEACNRINNR